MSEYTRGAIIGCATVNVILPLIIAFAMGDGTLTLLIVTVYVLVLYWALTWRRCTRMCQTCQCAEA